ncbi:MAG: NUDIX hydrolase [bacterium]|nr:NUDIX hydrolase [bacterium]
MAATPVPASTVILLRDGQPSPEVLLLERHAKSEFLPDLYVFPGGRVEDQDHALADRITGLDATGASAALPTVAAELALGFFVAAIRETFEESGILLARRRGETELLDEARASALSDRRLDVQSGDLAFRSLIEAEDLELAADRLSVHAHWITPAMVPRRFDTIFFSTRTPVGQRALHDGLESTDHVWIRPELALEELRAGKRQMILPTSLNLKTLAGFNDADSALEASRTRPVVPVLPTVVEENGRKKMVIPEEAGYGRFDDPVPDVVSKNS